MNPIEVLIPITAILVSGIVIGIPILGITLRFAIKPVAEAFLKAKSARADDRVPMLEGRIALMEEQLHALERSHDRLLEEAEFQRQLTGQR
jgi:hypothetical protein